MYYQFSGGMNMSKTWLFQVMMLAFRVRRGLFLVWVVLLATGSARQCAGANHDPFRIGTTLALRCAWTVGDGAILRMPVLHWYRSVYTSCGVVRESFRRRGSTAESSKRYLERLPLAAIRRNIRDVNTLPFGRCEWRLAIRLARECHERADGWREPDPLNITAHWQSEPGIPAYGGSPQGVPC